MSSGADTGQYRGRFAPSPTGPLHFGSLVAAVGSFLQARSVQGEWLVRIEDIDPPREQPGATAQILAALESFGLEWDGALLYQSSRYDTYRSVVSDLIRQGNAYPCTCTRSEIRAHNLRHTGSASTRYPGICREGVSHPGRRPAIRLNVPSVAIQFEDREVGSYCQNIAEVGGDFALRRRDDLYAYQLAVVVDDAEQEITEVVRGQDLLELTPGQIYLQQVLGLTTPDYLHLPLVKTPAGEKLSKQTGALPLDLARTPELLHSALAFLHLSPEAEQRHAAVTEQLSWAIDKWPDRSCGSTMESASGGASALE